MSLSLYCTEMIWFARIIVIEPTKNYCIKCIQIYHLLYQNYCIKCILIYCIKTIISKLLYQTIVSELLYQRILIIINDYNSSTLSFKRAGLLLLVLPLPQYLTTISPRRESDISAPIKVDLIFVTFYQSDEDP